MRSPIATVIPPAPRRGWGAKLTLHMRKPLALLCIALVLLTAAAVAWVSAAPATLAAICALPPPLLAVAPAVDDTCVAHPTRSASPVFLRGPPALGLSPQESLTTPKEETWREGDGSRRSWLT